MTGQTIMCFIIKVFLKDRILLWSPPTNIRWIIEILILVAYCFYVQVLVDQTKHSVRYCQLLLIAHAGGFFSHLTLCLVLENILESWFKFVYLLFLINYLFCICILLGVRLNYLLFKNDIFLLICFEKGDQDYYFSKTVIGFCTWIFTWGRLFLLFCKSCWHNGCS